MPASAPPGPSPRRPPYLTAAQPPRRGELAAALGTVAVLAHLLAAQLTLVLVMAFQLTSRLSRWRPSWLAVPAGIGLVWTLALGPARAASDLAAGPRQILAYFAGTFGSPGRILHPQRAFAGISRWLPGQLPLALLLAAGEAGLLWWLDWRRAGEQGRLPARPGLIVAARKRWTIASIRSGGVVTSGGGCLGVDISTGRPAEVSWPEAEGGVLCTAGGGPARPERTARGRQGGQGWPGGLDGAGGPNGAGGADGADGMLTGACFLLAHAGIRRRKPVVVVDLTGSRWLPAALSAACAGAGAALHSFGAAGQGYYEPVRGGDPGQAASLVMGMIDWTGVADPHRRTCAAYLADAFAVLAAAPGDPRAPILDELASLLTPDGLRARLGRVPSYHPRRNALADRVSVCARQIEADPAALTAAAAQLAELRSAPEGRWLAPGPARISLGQAVRDRAVVAFWLDQASQGRPARMIASLVARDLMAVCAELARIPVPGDALAWIHGCEALEERMLTHLIARGTGAGVAVQLSTASAAAAGALADAANVMVTSGPAGPAPARRPAEPAGPAPDYPFWLPGEDGDGGPASGRAPAGTFALLVKGPQPRLLPSCQPVPGGGLGGRW
jgi:hypothetical protein